MHKHRFILTPRLSKPWRIGIRVKCEGCDKVAVFQRGKIHKLLTTPGMKFRKSFRTM